MEETGLQRPAAAVEKLIVEVLLCHIAPSGQSLIDGKGLGSDKTISPMQALSIKWETSL